MQSALDRCHNNNEKTNYALDKKTKNYSQGQVFLQTQIQK